MHQANITVQISIPQVYLCCSLATPAVWITTAATSPKNSSSKKQHFSIHTATSETI